MKIKIWAFVLVIIGSLFLGAAGTFVVMSGVSIVGHLVQDVQAMVPRISIQAPDNGGNNGFGNGFGNGNGNGFGNGGSQQPGFYFEQPNIPALPSDLPEGFNAGVNIESTYAALTNRTVQDVQAAEEKAGTDVWGLANQEGKLKDLKTKVTDAVAASLKQMVTDKKITQAQSDEYMNWVKQYLQAMGRTNNRMMPGFGRGGQQIDPNATPGIIS